MKNWITSSLVVVIAVLIMVIGSQNRPANANDQVESLPAPRAVVILHCQRESAVSIKVVNVSRSFGALGLAGVTSCAEAVARLLSDGYTIQSASTDSTSGFNYTLVK